MSGSTNIATLPPPVEARHVRLPAVEAVNGNAAVGEINVISGGSG